MGHSGVIPRESAHSLVCQEGGSILLICCPMYKNWFPCTRVAKPGLYWGWVMRLLEVKVQEKLSEE